MPRVKRGKTHVKRRRRLLKGTKGYHWGRKNTIKAAKTATLKAGVHSYAGRRNKKRVARSGWLATLNAAVREEGMSYSKFIGAAKKKNIALDRKVLADIAINEPAAWKKIVEMVKA
ncbi:MAG: 50S ribosomal protein L20 [Candidatus Kerfeldbacteria bacterium RIFCSPHIGHO2_12_FULL_48_17]|uniref:Large ribosomal subunit protein bL20 n=1 Tax=Candidatus Kerfeldbacteria bacterium RIFCSPHIGHO2_12_FULL_48_17 TaxID=1798542 RepID=A0A1G2B7D6_9BACT|nr:MAG: 50S ribosomal protein L20 [Candidatus Kerfeldbacteria bacterium RIFCSPHIGHO2_12_FULL_48_17]